MAKSRKNRGSRSRSKSQKGGWGGWASHTQIGPSWNGENGGNHFGLSGGGIPSGNPMPVQAFWGPSMHQANQLVPHLSPNALSKGGNKRSANKRSANKRSANKRSANKGRSKRGGFVFGGLSQNIMTGVDNVKIGLQNFYRGFMGTNQLNSASPWNQPALSATAHQTVQPPPDLSAIRAAAHARVANVK